MWRNCRQPLGDEEGLLTASGKPDPSVLQLQGNESADNLSSEVDSSLVRTSDENRAQSTPRLQDYETPRRQLSHAQTSAPSGPHRCLFCSVDPRLTSGGPERSSPVPSKAVQFTHLLEKEALVFHPPRH